MEDLPITIDEEGIEILKRKYSRYGIWMMVLLAVSVLNIIEAGIFIAKGFTVFAVIVGAIMAVTIGCALFLFFSRADMKRTILFNGGTLKKEIPEPQPEEIPDEEG